MGETKTESAPHYVGRTQPRRSSRSALSGSPSTKEDPNEAISDSTATAAAATVLPSTSTSSIDSPSQNINDRHNTATTAATDTRTNASSLTPVANAATNHHLRVTRSISTEPNSNNEESSNINTMTTTTNGKRRRNTNSTRTSNKKKKGGSTVIAATTSPSSFTSESASPSSTTASKSQPRGTVDETRNARLSKEAKDAKKAEREISIKRKLDELDALEQNVKDQSHEEYQKLLLEIQSKRAKKLHATQGKLTLMETNLKNGFFAQKKLANDKFYLDKSALRQKMMKHVQQQINTIEQEYYCFHHQNDNNLLHTQKLAAWTPPDRPSMISSLTLGLDQQEVAEDIAELQALIPSERAKQDTHLLTPPPKKDPLPLDSSS